ncbi:MAG: tripartite tricarboxylate transporter substrate binding protein [Rhodospirillaceae bacterium]|nr:tripartite tricarboxylate transporter substrate binding protein [Rhodospirillaceae bacterium]
MCKTVFGKGIVAALLGVALVSSPVFAADYPSKDVRIIVPFKPGGGVDTTSRILAEYGNKHMKNAKLVVENRAGGGGIVGQTFAAKAKPNGYTVLAMTSSVVTNPVLKETEYKISDFRPVALYNMDPEVIVVGAASPFKTIADLVKDAKVSPLSVTVAGIATSHHMAGLALEDSAGLKFTYVPTKGFGGQLQAVMGGHVQVALFPLGEIKKHADAGSVRILAVAADKRMAILPDVPTWQESGLNIKRWTTFRGWAVPKGTPDAAVAYLSDLLGKVSVDEGYIKQMTDYGYPIAYEDAKGFAEVVSDYADLTDKVIKKHGLKGK